MEKIPGFKKINDGAVGQLRQSGFKVNNVDERNGSATFIGPDAKEWTVKQNKNLGFDVYDSTGKKVIDDVNILYDNIATRILQNEQSPERVDFGDFDRDEDYERSWGPSRDEEDEEYKNSEFTDDEISEALSDYVWSVTDETTAGQYAQEVADRLGTSKERVFDIIKQQAPTQINENSNMNKIIDAYEGDYEYKEDATNWYDKLQDNEYTRLYRDDALKVAPERQNLIVNSMREYVDEKPVRGFISNDQIKRYTAKLGLDKLSDEELSQMLKDIDDIGGLLAHGTSYQQGGRELDDARSAFVELVNNEARNRRGGKTREDAIRKITEMARSIEQYDADDARGYLTRSQADFIEQAVNKYNITKDELRKISRIFNPGEYGQFGK